MEPETVAALIARVRELWSVAPDAEITLEANPTSAEIEKFRAFRAGGVNRVSLGVQSLIANDLAFLGRQHDGPQALAAVEMAAATFDRFSFDLIYARPNQTPDAWRTELDRALGFAAGHISLYQLTIEQGTQFEQAVARGDFHMLDDDRAAELYEATVERLGAAELDDYEISNFAKPGQESRHNLTYWRYGDYVASAPGRMAASRSATVRSRPASTARRNRGWTWWRSTATPRDSATSSTGSSAATKCC